MTSPIEITADEAYPLIAKATTAEHSWLGNPFWIIQITYFDDSERFFKIDRLYDLNLAQFLDSKAETAIRSITLT